MAKCPHQSVCPFHQVELPDGGIYSYQMDARPLFGRKRKQQRQEQVATTLPPQQTTNIAGGELQPGEERHAKLFRARTVADLSPYLLYASIGGLAVGGFLLTVGAPFRASLASAIGTFGVAFLAPVTLMWFKDGPNMMMKLEEMFRTDLNGDGVIGQHEYHAAGELTDGKSTLYTRFKISDPHNWYRFCQAVHGGDNFSLRTAKGKEIKDAEFKRIVRQWASPDPKLALIEPESVGVRKTLVLTKQGKLMVKSFARTPPLQSE